MNAVGHRLVAKGLDMSSDLSRQLGWLNGRGDNTPPPHKTKPLNPCTPPTLALGHPSCTMTMCLAVMASEICTNHCMCKTCCCFMSSSLASSLALITAQGCNSCQIRYLPLYHTPSWCGTAAFPQIVHFETKHACLRAGAVLPAHLIPFADANPGCSFHTKFSCVAFESGQSHTLETPMATTS